MHRFDTSHPPHLHVEVRSGTLDHRHRRRRRDDRRPPADGHDSKASRDAVAATDVEQRGDDIVVVVPKRLGSMIGRSCDLALTVTSPHARPSRSRPVPPTSSPGVATPRPR